MILIAEVIKVGGPTREGVLEGLRKVENVPSVIYGTANFDLETQRVRDPEFVGLQVVNGEFVLWDGTKPGAE
jgi:branched-chain amino acid transport system substrate-binding protein